MKKKCKKGGNEYAKRFVRTTNKVLFMKYVFDMKKDAFG